MTKAIEHTQENGEGGIEKECQEHLEEYLRETDQAAVEKLSQRYRDVASPERIRQMEDVPTAFEDREAFDRGYRHAGGEKLEPGERVLGYSEGLEAPAHVATDEAAIRKTVIHERLHQLSDPGSAEVLGRRLHEGITEDLAMENASELPGVESPEVYPEEQVVAHELRNVCGDRAVEKAYFQGDAAELRSCLDRNFGEDGLERLREELDNPGELEKRHELEDDQA